MNHTFFATSEQVVNSKGYVLDFPTAMDIVTRYNGVVHKQGAAFDNVIACSRGTAYYFTASSDNHINTTHKPFKVTAENVTAKYRLVTDFTLQGLANDAVRFDNPFDNSTN